jgi:hypothetical protein
LLLGIEVIPASTQDRDGAVDLIKKTRRKPGETTRRLTVTIGDASGKLAGTYSDVITISTLSSM